MSFDKETFSSTFGEGDQGSVPHDQYPSADGEVQGSPPESQGQDAPSEALAEPVEQSYQTGYTADLQYPVGEYADLSAYNSQEQYLAVDGQPYSTAYDSSNPSAQGFYDDQASSNDYYSHSGAEFSTVESSFLVDDTDNRPKFSMKINRKTIICAFVIAGLIALVCYSLLKPPATHVAKPADYSGSPGQEVIVGLKGETITDFAQILYSSGVVASSQAFIDAAGNSPISLGFYRIPQHIPAAKALEYLTTQQDQARVGRIIIPPGTTLLDHWNNKHKKVPGIFELLARASCVGEEKDHNKPSCYTKTSELYHVAATAKPADLGVPSWAMAAVSKLPHDVRRLEGLIYARTWDTIDPRDSALKKLHDLITDSAAVFAQKGLIPPANTAIQPFHSPYELLTVASIAEREAGKSSDYGKIGRVIFNRLTAKEPMHLDMDSTINYTFGGSELDFDETNLTTPTPWNTRVIWGLPITPIASVGDDALAQVLNPPAGRWKYFVTVDDKGNTLFANTYAEHQHNLQIACHNHFLTTQCPNS